MVTTVGTENELIDLLQNLITLDFDAIEAYEAAIDRLDDKTAQDKLRSFIKDHRRHTEDLSPHLRGMGGDVPSGSGVKSLLTQGKVEAASLMGDCAVLKAMASNETDTVTAYEKAAERDDVDGQLREKLQAGLEDEKRHKAWMQDRS